MSGAPMSDLAAPEGHGAFRALGMTQEIRRGDDPGILTTRCPIRIDGGLLTSDQGSPRAGEQTTALDREFQLGEGIDAP